MMYKYEHGGDIYTEKLTKDGRSFVDYSANINPLGLPLGIKQAVQQALKLVSTILIPSAASWQR